ncbi:MAG: glycosyltransferase family 2 protein [Planctomycetia bacterium]
MPNAAPAAPEAATLLSTEPAAPFPILVKVWCGKERHDFRYVTRSLPSLLASGLPPAARVHLVDDCSTDRRLQPFLEKLAADHPRVVLRRNPFRMGPNAGQAYNFALAAAEHPDAEYFLVCDDDILYQPGWLTSLVDAYKTAGALGHQGIFTAINVKLRPPLAELRAGRHLLLIKERQAAFNWLVPRSVYETVGPFRDVGIAYDTEYAVRLKALGYHVYCLKPSLVQNIGWQGAYQKGSWNSAADSVVATPWAVVFTEWEHGFFDLAGRAGRKAGRWFEAARRRIFSGTERS